MDILKIMKKVKLEKKDKLSILSVAISFVFIYLFTFFICNHLHDVLAKKSFNVYLTSTLIISVVSIILISSYNVLKELQVSLISILLLKEHSLHNYKLMIIPENDVRLKYYKKLYIPFKTVPVNKLTNNLYC